MIPMMILPALIWKKLTDASGNPLINEETGVQAQELIGKNVFLAALIMGVLGFSAVLMFVSLAFIYNVNKKTHAQMAADLAVARGNVADAPLAEEVAIAE